MKKGLPKKYWTPKKIKTKQNKPPHKKTQGQHLKKQKPRQKKHRIHTRNLAKKESTW